MRILLATNHILSWTGSELTIATLAALLREQGHEVHVYASFVPHLPTAQQVITACPVSSDLSHAVAFAPEVAYTQHHPVAMEVRHALPELPIVHALLGVLPHLEQPPRRDLALSRLLAISEEVQAHAASHAGGVELELFRNLVDDRAFDDEPADRPLRSVAVYSYKLLDRHRAGLAAAAAQLGLDLLDHQPVQAGRTPYDTVPARVRSGEVVACSGRGAIETMLSARVPLIVADCGDDGLVTPDNFHQLMRFNFSGRRHGRQFEGPDIGAALQDYRPELGAELQRLARAHFGTRARSASIATMFEQAQQQAPRPLGDEARQHLAFDLKTQAEQRRFARLGMPA